MLSDIQVLLDILFMQCSLNTLCCIVGFGGSVSCLLCDVCSTISKPRNRQEKVIVLCNSTEFINKVLIIPSLYDSLYYTIYYIIYFILYYIERVDIITYIIKNSLYRVYLRVFFLESFTHTLVQSLFLAERHIVKRKFHERISK